MKPDEARQMVENLGRGIDPYIGRELPIQDVCVDPDVQEALRIVLDYCTIELATSDVNAKKPRKLSSESCEAESGTLDIRMEEKLGQVLRFSTF